MFFVIAEPLVKLLDKRMTVLSALNFNEEFKLTVVASDVGASGVLLQEDDNGVDHPVYHFFQKI